MFAQRSACGLFAVLAIQLLGLEARADEIRVIAAGALPVALGEINPGFERASGHKISITYGTVPTMIQQITAGAAFDLALVPPEVLKHEVAGKRFAPGPSVDFAKVGFGVAVRPGAPSPDISTSDAFKQAVLAAPSVTYFVNNLGGAYIASVFERLGIANEVKIKTRAQTEIGKIIGLGEKEIAFEVTNFLVVSDVKFVGPFPAELQRDLVVTGALAADTKSADAAKAYILYLRSPEAVAVFKAKGLNPM